MSRTEQMINYPRGKATPDLRKAQATSHAEATLLQETAFWGSLERPSPRPCRHLRPGVSGNDKVVAEYGFQQLASCDLCLASPWWNCFRLHASRPCDPSQSHTSDTYAKQQHIHIVIGRVNLIPLPCA